jgi:hypothetical protein
MLTIAAFVPGVETKAGEGQLSLCQDLRRENLAKGNEAFARFAPSQTLAMNVANSKVDDSQYVYYLIHSFLSGVGNKGCESKEGFIARAGAPL